MIVVVVLFIKKSKRSPIPVMIVAAVVPIKKSKRSPIQVMIVVVLMKMILKIIKNVIYGKASNYNISYKLTTKARYANLYILIIYFKIANF
jgi:hypothetical protein